ncbi:hypothetical protein HN51_056321 [Arachis hypogaea]|uniref:Prolamin-like domain-containing protein n=1 Tax=Arachis hypogaea TaxID=3818 RepID=A0A444XUE3_ARAHY|nr:egg cell-secreted protein 1.2-like [Arachis ipaensis]XP_025679117.1 egg cell-secreted protein 1.2-like [Arachis hypogaea]RYQ93075.1 hypothetical protein Ahy_B09g099334 [Arachis hypogaea]
MAHYTNHNVYIVTIILVATTLASNATTSMSESAHPSLATRLKVDGEPESINCWDSLFQLQACTGEVIMFFLNGETYLGPSCCHAIIIVGHDCWPQMLASLGFSAEETDILQGYCDAEQQHHHHYSPPSPPSPPPSSSFPLRHAITNNS